MTGFHIEEVTIDKNVDTLSPIDEDSARISIPREVVESTIAEGAPVRMASFLFRNMTGLLPESLGDEDQNETITLVWNDWVVYLAIPQLSYIIIIDHAINYYTLHAGIKRIVCCDWPLQLSPPVSSVIPAPHPTSPLQ